VWDIVDVKRIDRENYFQQIRETGLKRKLLRFFVVLQFEVQLLRVINDEFTAVSAHLEILGTVLSLLRRNLLIVVKVIVRSSVCELRFVIFEITE
jgi:hypothetical protein